MENDINKKKSDSKIKLKKVLFWIVGILIMLMGFASLKESVLGGFFMILASLIIIPAVPKFIQKKWNFSVSRKIKIIAVIMLLIISAMFLPEQPKLISQVQNNNVVENNIETQTETSDEQVISNDVSSINQAVKMTTTSSTIPPTNSQYKYYSVSSVVDGDTVKINKDGTVITLRLIGMDTPETVDPRKPVQCFGKEASNKAKELLSGKKIRIETDSTQGDLDKYGRTLAYIYREDGLFYNKYMIEQGYAHEYTYNLPYKYQTEFRNAQKQAQANQMGLWSPNTCNGDTTSEATIETTTSTGNFYTSSYSTSKYYYPESCDEWKSLNVKYLKSFTSLELLLSSFPSRTLSPQCQ